MQLPDVSQPDMNPSRLAQVLTEWKALALLGGPIMVAQLAQIANGVIDTVMSGHVSAEDLAGVGIGTSLWVPLQLFFMGVLSALQPIISGHRGAKQSHHIMPVTWQGIYIALGCSVAMILLLVNARPVLDILRLDAQTAAISQGYLNAFAWGVPAFLLLIALRGLTDGLGHTRVIMVFSLVNTLFNLPLNYIFIYGKLGLPAMGGVGCGWAAAIANWVSIIALVIYLNRSKTYASFHLLADRVVPKWVEIKHILRLGLPIGFTIFVEVSMFSVIALFLAPLGPIVVAGHQIVLNAISLLFMVPLSLGMALTLRISFLVGAHEHERARRLARSVLVLALGISLINMPVLLFGREMIAGFYTHDAAVRDVAIQLFLVGAIFQVADIVQVTMINTLRGYRDTRIPMFIMLLSFWAICLPLGYLLTFTSWIIEPMGASGFWVALCVGLTIASILLTYRVMCFRHTNS